jgi:hypothetical protein
MPKLDSSIYGSDDTEMASSIASDALGPPSEYAWCGRPTGEEGAKGNRPNTDSEVKVKNVGGGGDKRACVKGNHGEQGCND